MQEADWQAEIVLALERSGLNVMVGAEESPASAHFSNELPSCDVTIFLTTWQISLSKIESLELIWDAIVSIVTPLHRMYPLFLISGVIFDSLFTPLYLS